MKVKQCKTEKIQDSCVTCIKKSLSLFNELSEDELYLLNKNRVTVFFKKNEPIYKENTKPSGLYCLNEGKVKIIKYSPKGNEIILALKRPVDFLGIETLVTGKNHAHTAIAIEDSSVCIIDETHFNKILTTNIKFTQKLLKDFASTILNNHNHYINITQKQIRARIADTLLELKTFYDINHDGYIDVALKRHDIAALSGMTTANVIRTISAFEKENIIMCNKKRIKILNVEQLKKISSSQE